MSSQLVFKEESYAIQGAVFEVYRELGSGFLEAVYQECLEKELAIRKISFEAQRPLNLWYKGLALEQVYKVDFVCYGRIILEIKATRELAGEHRAQVLNYLKACGMNLGLLANFGSHPKAVVGRFVL